MTNPPGNDDKGAEGSLAHNAGWNDVWAGLLVTLFLLGSAMLVAILFSGWPSRLRMEDERAAVHTNRLQGVRDPARLGWRPPDRPWHLTGIHETRPGVDDTAGGMGR